MRIFDTKVQLLKYKVLKEVINSAYDNNFDNIYVDAPKRILPGPKSDMRCCIYKGRAVLQQRIQLAMGGNKNPKEVMEVMDIACDECPTPSFMVTEACRGCISHMCMETCPVGAISFSENEKRAKIDPDKCIECGKCQKACPYGAILQNVRPCVRACKVNAIEIDDATKKAKINYDKCVSCGACVYRCPFGAIGDKSYVLDCVDILKESEGSKKFNVYAVIAPSIVSQFKYAKIGQVITGMKKLGFHQVVEAALGADITLEKEIREFQEKDKMSTSCCPSYVLLVEKHFPAQKVIMSHSDSPMIETAKLLKHLDPTGKVVFIGPCTAKKYEFKREEKEGIVDCVLTFEELQAFFDAREVVLENLEEGVLDNASYFGRIFASTGGITKGLQKLKEKYGYEKEIKAIKCDGLEQAKIAFLKLKVNKLEENLLEVMACENGCVNGPCCLHQNPKRALDVDAYAKTAKEEDIGNSLRLYETAYGVKLGEET